METTVPTRTWLEQRYRGRKVKGTFAMVVYLRNRLMKKNGTDCGILKRRVKNFACDFFIDTNPSFMNINLATISVHWRSRNLEMKDRLDIAKMALAIHMAGACQFWRGGSDVINVNQDSSYEQILVYYV